jgi:hypothetical protein
MELSLRPYVTAGVVVAGAGLIAAAPVGPSALEIQTRAVQLVVTDDLAADVVSAAAAAAPQEFPVSTWADVFLNAFSNLESLQSDFGLNADPILQAIAENQVIYSNDLATAAETAGTNLVNALQDFPNVLSNAMSDLANGDVFDAQTSIMQFLTQTPLNVIRPLDNGFFEVAQSISSHLNNLLAGTGVTNYDIVSDATAPSSVPQWVSELIQAQLMAPHAAELAFAGVSQDIVTALQGGDSTLAFSDLVNAPSTVLDAYLNGYNLGDDGGGAAKFVDAVPELLRNVSAQGLLSNQGALVTVREAIETIARDISPQRMLEAPTTGVADAAGAAGAGVDLHALVADLSTLLSPDSALGDFVTAFDPNAIADITSLLTADLAPNASGWVTDLFALF